MARFFVRPLLAGLVLTGCAHGTRPVEDHPGATVALRAALVSVPVVTTVSCRGPGLCRESTFAPDETEDVEEAKDDCAARKGRVGQDPCPEAGALVTCAGSGTRVVAYAQADRSAQDDAVEALTSLCELHGGSLEGVTEGAL